MAYTKHGWHIPGTSDFFPPPNRARCGGIKICPECKSEATSVSAYVDVPDESSEVFDHIPSASLSDEDLRLECLSVAADLMARFRSDDRAERTIEIAKQFFEYVRPTDA